VVVPLRTTSKKTSSVIAQHSTCCSLPLLFIEGSIGVTFNPSQRRPFPSHFSNFSNLWCLLDLNLTEIKSKVNRPLNRYMDWWRMFTVSSLVSLHPKRVHTNYDRCLISI
jgi:hypothetical protein